MGTGCNMALLMEIIIPVVIAIVTLVPIAVIALLNRGKRLKCPNCANTFKAPLMDEKMLGVGWTFPYMGNVECPHCHAMHSRRGYKTVKKETAAKSNQ